MTAVNYEALRSITAGHTINVFYDLDITLERANRGVKPKTKAIKSLGGNQETILQSIDYTHQLTIGSITSAELDITREFLDSVQGGEVFTLDIMGSVATPVNVISVIANPGYTESRVNNSQLYTVSLTVREV